MCQILDLLRQKLLSSPIQESFWFSVLQHVLVWSTARLKGVISAHTDAYIQVRFKLDSTGTDCSVIVCRLRM